MVPLIDVIEQTQQGGSKLILQMHYRIYIHHFSTLNFVHWENTLDWNVFVMFVFVILPNHIFQTYLTYLYLVFFTLLDATFLETSTIHNESFCNYIVVLLLPRFRDAFYLFITQCSKILLILYWSNVYLYCKVSTWTNDECTYCWKILISVQISVYSVSFTKLFNKISFYHQQLVKNNFPRRLIKNSRPKEPISFKILKFM